MKIAYLAEWQAYRSSGVLNKISMQSKLWQKLGHEVQVFLVSPPEEDPVLPPEMPGLQLFTHPLSSRIPQKGIYYVNKLLSVAGLEKAVKTFLPDFIYYRQGIWYPGLLKVLRLAPFAVEINSLEANELKLMSLLKRTVHLKTRNMVLGKAAALVAVSHEIAESLAEFDKPTVVVSNGFDTSSITIPTKTKNDRCQLIFAGSPDMTWHGVDKLLFLAEHCPDYDFHIVGPSIKVTLQNVTVYGLLTKTELYKLYPQMDIGIGTLALHRAGLEEASPLKVREYLAFSLPVVVGYEDTDLKDCEYALNLGNFEDNVKDNVLTIRRFVTRWHNKAIPYRDVQERIDLSYKETRKIEFIQTVVKQS
ncbi:MAG: glycosyltransferase family 4 protein [Trueperaceae bacterium]|nr:glycosyltransferase family 4 protein [Trueperaceae bacterium]